jgi:hypothetical protein
MFLTPGFYTKTRLLCLIVGSLLIINPLYGQAAPADDHLREVESDAKRLATSPVTTEDAGILNTLGSVERLPLGLQQGDFETALREQFMGTYLFYQRLNALKKRKVFEIYQKDNRVSSVRAQTLKLLSSKSR